MEGGFHLTDKFMDNLSAVGIKSKSNVFYTEHVKAYLFLNQASFQLISDTSRYGFIFLQQLRPDVDAPAKEADLQNPGCTYSLPPACFREIRNYVYKISFIRPLVADGEEEEFMVDDNVKGFVTETEFTNETALHYELYNNAFMNGQNIVPPILSAKPIIIKNRDDIIFKSCMTDPAFVKSYKAASVYGHFDIGVICMGFAEGYETADNLINIYPEHTGQIITLARLAYLTMLLSGYIHGDTHLGNVMINPNYRDWVSPDYVGRAIAIDFGRTRPLNAEEKATVKRVLAIGSAKQLLKLVYKGNLIQDPLYDWLINPQFPGDDVNPPIHALIENYKRHELAIKTYIPIYDMNKSVDEIMMMLKRGGKKKQSRAKNTKIRRLTRKRC